MDATSSSNHIVKTGSAGRRLGLVTASIGAFALLSFVLPTHHHVTQQGVVMPDAFEAVASDVGGVIEKVYVETGQAVKANDLLVTLRNPEIESELKVAEANREQARVRFGALRYQKSWSMGEGSARLAQELELAEAGYERALARQRGLQLRAKADGFVLTPGVQRFAGNYITPGLPFIRLGDSSRLRITIPLSEDEAQLVSRGSAVTGRWLSNGEKFECVLDSVASQPAKSSDFHVGMLTYYGGPVPSQLFDRHAKERAEHPIFFASAVMPKPAHAVLEGLRVRVTIEGHATTLGRKLWRWFASLFSLKTTSMQH